MQPEEDRAKNGLLAELLATEQLLIQQLNAELRTKRRLSWTRFFTGAVLGVLAGYLLGTLSSIR